MSHDLPLIKKKLWDLWKSVWFSKKSFILVFHCTCWRAVHNHMTRSGCMFTQAYVDWRPVAVATGFATCLCCLWAPCVMNRVLETVCAQQMLHWFVLQIFKPLLPSPPSVIHSLILSYVKVCLPLFVSAALHQLHSSLRWYVIILLLHYCLDEGWRKE